MGSHDSATSDVACRSLRGQCWGSGQDSARLYHWKGRRVKRTTSIHKWNIYIYIKNNRGAGDANKWICIHIYNIIQLYSCTMLHPYTSYVGRNRRLKRTTQKCILTPKKQVLTAKPQNTWHKLIKATNRSGYDGNKNGQNGYTMTLI